jgi:uncharacterized protein YbjQ (UPF0145 family)
VADKSPGGLLILIAARLRALRLKGKSTMRGIVFLCVLALAFPLYPGYSEDRIAEPAHVMAVPVFEGDVERPYEVIGEIKDNLRKPLAFMPDPSREKILAEIWERGRKMGADAVINARFGATEKTLFNHGRTPISGTAIKFKAESTPAAK